MAHRRVFLLSMRQPSLRIREQPHLIHFCAFVNLHVGLKLLTHKKIFLQNHQTKIVLSLKQTNSATIAMTSCVRIPTGRSVLCISEYRVHYKGITSNDVKMDVPIDQLFPLKI